MPQIEVSFDIDANGIVNVSAKDKASGKETKITITDSSGLSDKEIEKMVRDAKEHEEEDRKTKDLVEKRNRLDSTIIGVEKAVKENKEKLGTDDVATLEAAIEKAKKDLKDHENDAAQLEKSTEELAGASHKIYEILQKQANEAQAAGAKPEGDKQAGQDSGKKEGEEEPIDADIEN